MASKRAVSLWLASVFVAAAGIGLAADTVILRNGDRVQGQLVGIRNGEVEFREDRGFSSRTVVIDLREVRRIEFDDNYTNPGTRGPNFGPGDTGRRGASDRPSPGMRERLVTVTANTPWVDTGIEVQDGQRLFFKASGQVTWGRGRRDGPDGERNSPFNATRPIPSRPAAALIGKVGNRGSDPFLIGSDESGIRIRGNGRLFLGINDDFLGDNSGAFRVTVYY